jgi:hypothetical protein
MAHLGTRALVPVLAAAGLACNSSDVTTRVTASLYEQAVRCEPTSTCTPDPAGPPVTGERIDVAGILSSGASQFDPGLYVYAGGFRASGAFFELELDLPAYVGEETRELSASYREYFHALPIFQSARVGGEIQIVALAGQDGPYAGIFDLQFTDFGPDDAPGTPDDRVRSLRFGSFTLSGREPENPPRPEYTWGDRVVIGVDTEVVIDDPAYDYETDGCDGSVPEGYNEGTGCEGDTSTDPGGGAGCQGDTTGDVGGGAGCEGDTSGDVGGGAGCEGDTGGGGSGCSGDTGGGSGCSGSGSSGGCDAAAGPSSAALRRSPGRRSSRIFSASLPLLALLVTRRILRRR